MSPETEGHEKQASHEFDISLISELVYAMNTAGSKLSAYPDGHPFVIEAFGKVQDLLLKVFQSRNQLTFGIAKNTIMVGASTLDRRNPVFQRFAQSLFDHGLIGLTMLRGITSSELIGFHHIIAQKRNDVTLQGGFQALLAKANARHIRVQLIDYGLFQTHEGFDENAQGAASLQSASFWEVFVNGLLEGSLLTDEESKYLDPETIGRALNKKYLGKATDTLERLGRVLAGNMNYSVPGRFEDSGDSSEKMAGFIQTLSNELKQRFVEQFFKSLPVSEEAAIDMVSNLPEEVILDALEKNANNELYMPPNVVKIMQRLSGGIQESGGKADDEFLNSHSKEELSEKLKVIFKEDEADRFIPVDYQRALQNVIAANELSEPDFLEVQQLGLTLTSQNINLALANVLADIIISVDNDKITDSIQKRFRECCISLVHDGDFYQVLNIIEMIDGKNYPREDKNNSCRKAAEILSNTTFAVEVLKSFAHWGKDKQFYTAKLIRIIGPAFIEPLLDQLAEEENKTIRLFFLNSLKEFGMETKDAVIRRLTDGRWYYVRNLLYILRNLNDPTVLDSIHNAFIHSHPQVRAELLHILIALKDPRAVGILVKEMDSPDHNQRLKAIQFAGETQDQAIIQKLLDLLTHKGLNKTDLEIKKAVVNSLAEIADPGVLPSYEKILKSFALFSRGRLRDLKLEIIKSLERYSSLDVLPFLAGISKSQSRPLADEISRTMKKFEASKQ